MVAVVVLLVGCVVVVTVGQAGPTLAQEQRQGGELNTEQGGATFIQEPQQTETPDPSDGRNVTTPPGGEWPDSCEDAPTVNASGVYRGTIDSPDDADWLNVTLAEKGEFVELRPLVPTAEQVAQIESEATSGSHSWQPISVADGIDQFDYSIELSRRAGVNSSTWRIFAETGPAAFCFGVSELQPDGTDIPNEWELDLRSPPPEPAGLNDRVLTRNEIDEYEERLTDLEEQVASLQRDLTRIRQNESLTTDE
jgi:hypothetical protein